MTQRLPLSTLAATAVLLAVPANSLALGGATDRKCYTHYPPPLGKSTSDPINLSLNGGTPGANFQVTATVPGKGDGSAGSTTGTFDAQGNGVAQIEDVSPPGGSIDPLKGRKVQLSVKDFGNNTTASLGTVRITNLALSVAAKPRRPERARTVRVSGTPFARKKLYGFVTSRRGKHVLRRFKIGRANRCGYAKTRAIVAPAPIRFGRFALYVNAGRKLARKRALPFAFRIYKTYL